MSGFSLQTIEALAMVITGGSASVGADAVPGKYRSAWHLAEFFNGIGVDFAVDNRSRVPAVRECLDELNKSNFSKIQEAIHAVSDPRDYLDEPDRLNAVVEYMNKRLHFDGFELRQLGTVCKLVGSANDAVAAAALREAAENLDLASVTQNFEQALTEANSNPEGAITAACSTVESVCKCLLDEMGFPYPARQDIKGLVTEVGKHLNLSPARKDLPAEYEQDIRQILGGLSSVTGGIGALRTHVGDAHGRGKLRVAADARIARLAIHSASTVSLFFIETWQRMNEQIGRTTQR